MPLAALGKGLEGATKKRSEKVVRKAVASGPTKAGIGR